MTTPNSIPQPTNQSVVVNIMPSTQGWWKRVAIAKFKRKSLSSHKLKNSNENSHRLFNLIRERCLLNQEDADKRVRNLFSIKRVYFKA